MLDPSKINETGWGAMLIPPKDYRALEHIRNDFQPKNPVCSSSSSSAMSKNAHIID
jgi:hypothetical protein